MQRACSAALTALLFASFIFAAHAMWGSWSNVYVQKDSYGYLEPVAKALYEDRWDHVQGRPFVYSGLILLVIRLGGSLSTVVAIQVAMYVAGAFVLYKLVRTPATACDRSDRSSPQGDVISKLAGLSVVALYFGQSNDYASSALYLQPELVCSFLSVLGLYAVAQLTAVRDSRPTRVVALGVVSALCAGLLFGLKPSFGAVATLLLVVACVAVARQSSPMSSVAAGSLILALLSIPATVLTVNSLMVQRYADSDAVLFGVRTAFCNNANLIAPALELADGEATRVVGAEGAQQTATFLRDASSSPGSHAWPILGFYGDRCLYTERARLEKIEDLYLGDNPEQVAGTYRHLLGASVLDDPSGFARRFTVQLREFILRSPPVDCKEYVAPDPGQGSSLVSRLLREKSASAGARVLPASPLSPMVCTAFEFALGALQTFFVSTALLILAFKGRALTQLDCQFQRGAATLCLCVSAWISAALIVALVHTFDVYRYISVTLPLFLAPLGLSIPIVCRWTTELIHGRQRTVRN